jgi:hypothetical protein
MPALQSRWSDPMNNRTPSSALRRMLATLILVGGFSAPALAADDVHSFGPAIAERSTQALSEIHQQTREDLQRSLRRPVDGLARLCPGGGGTGEEIRLNAGTVEPCDTYHPRHG